MKRIGLCRLNAWFTLAMVPPIFPAWRWLNKTADTLSPSTIRLTRIKKPERKDRGYLEDRVNFVCPADYSEDKEIHKVVKTVLDKIKSDYDFELLLKKHKDAAVAIKQKKPRIKDKMPWKISSALVIQIPMATFLTAAALRTICAISGSPAGNPRCGLPCGGRGTVRSHHDIRRPKPATAARPWTT